MKDTKYVQILLGIVVPLCLVVVVIYNLATWTVFLVEVPRRLGIIRLLRHGRGVAITDSYSVVGVVLIKISLAGALASWFWFANRDETEHWGPTGLVISGGVAVIGLVVVVIGVFAG